ncbi:MAG: putative motility protein [Bradyrhizobium sp.]
MDITSIVSGILATREETRQLQLATAVLRPSAVAQKIAAETISAAQASPAKLAPGVGGNLDVTA